MYMYFFFELLTFDPQLIEHRVFVEHFESGQHDREAQQQGHEVHMCFSVDGRAQSAKALLQPSSKPHSVQASICFSLHNHKTVQDEKYCKIMRVQWVAQGEKKGYYTGNATPLYSPKNAG